MIAGADTKAVQWNCEAVKAQFSSNIDGTLTGRERQQFQNHTENCGECRAEFAEWQQMHAMLAGLGPKKAPANLGLRLRVAISQARANSTERLLQRWEMRWHNTLRPLALQWSAGLASAVVVVAVTALMVGMFAAPQSVQASSAKDEPVGMATAPHYLYSMLPSASLQTDVNSAVVVEVFLGTDGRVYDYKIVAGEDTPGVRAQLNTLLYFTVFTPARVFGRPIPGHAVMSYGGVAVHG